MELLDVVDENNELTGKAMDRDVIHDQEILHREVAVWIMNEKGEVLIQKRSATKKNEPNMWGVTAGHLAVNEEPTLGMLREMKEEIGINVLKEELELLSIEKCDDVNNKCFVYMYFYQTDKKQEEYVLQKEEVSYVKYVTVEELKIISQTKDASTFSQWEIMSGIFKKLEERKRRIIV